MPDIDPLITDREAAGLLGISASSFWRRVKDQTVPKPIKLGGLSRWPRSEILDVIEQAKAARNHSTGTASECEGGRHEG